MLRTTGRFQRPRGYDSSVEASSARLGAIIQAAVPALRSASTALIPATHRKPRTNEASMAARSAVLALLSAGTAAWMIDPRRAEESSTEES